MEAYDHDPCEPPSTCCKDHEERVVAEAVDLLEECWFFHNLLDRKPRMVRCFSDPCPSSSDIVDQAVLEKSNIIERVQSFSLPTTTEEQPPRSNLLRTPSLPPNIGRRELEGSNKEKHKDVKRRSKLTRQSSQKLVPRGTTGEPPPCVERKAAEKEKGRDCDGRKSKTTTGHQPLRRNLQRTPSLPPNIGRTEIIYHQGYDIDPANTIAKTACQTPNLADILPRPHKVLITNSQLLERVIDKLIYIYIYIL